MRKSLYTEKDHYTDDAINLNLEAYNALRGIVENYHEKGYSLREICHVIMGSVEALECEMILVKILKY